MKYLCVMSDDFGMHPAINAGIVDAFQNGILTDSNIMASAPFADEAISLAKQYQIPVGLHATFTCEWDRLRWGGLTSPASMQDEHGFFFASVERAWQNADPQEAMAEVEAQYQKLILSGLSLTHAGEHMGLPWEISSKVIQRFVAQTNLPWRVFDSTAEKIMHRKVDGGFGSSGVSTSYEEVKSFVLDRLKQLPDGYNIWICHAGMDMDSLAQMCSDDLPTKDWARLYRAIDYKLMMDQDVKSAIDELQIVLTPFEKFPVSG